MSYGSAEFASCGRRTRTRSGLRRPRTSLSPRSTQFALASLQQVRLTCTGPRSHIPDAEIEEVTTEAQRNEISALLTETESWLSEQCTPFLVSLLWLN